MRRIALRVLSSLCLAWMALPVHATVFTWNLGELGDLSHQNAYKWGLGTGNAQGIALYNQLLSGDYEISGATLTLKNIWDWQPEADRLYVHLLDNPFAGTQAFTDNSADNVNDGDDFAGQGTYLGYWTDPNGGQPHHADVVYDLASATHPGFLQTPPTGTELLAILNDYILGNNSRSFFGLAFDPDCHYFNDGIVFQIETGEVPQEPNDPTVPEPATLALTGIGLSVLTLARRRRRV